MTGEVCNHARPNTAHDSSVAEYVVCAYKYFDCLGEESSDAVQQGVVEGTVNDAHSDLRFNFDALYVSFLCYFNL